MLVTHSRFLLAGYTKQCTRLYSAAAPAVSKKTKPTQGLGVDPGTAADLPTVEERSTSEEVHNLVNQIANLSLVDVVDLNKLLKKRLKLPDAPMMPAGMMMAAAAPTTAADPAAGENKEAPKKEKKYFAAKLTAFDPEKKVTLIKEIRKFMTDMNLVQAKKFIESAPVDIKIDIPKAEADKLKAELEAFGATIEIV